MRIAFFGTPEYAVPTLDALVAAGHEVAVVVAQPDRPSGRGKKLRSPAVAVRGRALGLDVRQPRAIRSGPFPENFAKMSLDVGIVVAYGRILTPDLLAVPARGMINGHGSLLPAWRGAAPIEWAILSGDTVTGVTTMQMDAGLDTGPMLLTTETPIGADETGPALRVRLAESTAALIVETLARLDTITPRPQPQAGVSHAPPIYRDHGRIDWTEEASAICNRARALTPRPGAWCTFRGSTFKLHAGSPVAAQGTPGQVLEAGPGLVVAAGEGAVSVLVGQLPGKKAHAARDLINGARIEAGEEFQ